MIVTPLIEYWRELHTRRASGNLHPHIVAGSSGNVPATGITTKTICTPPGGRQPLFGQAHELPRRMLVYKTEMRSYKDLPQACRTGTCLPARKSGNSTVLCGYAASPRRRPHLYDHGADYGEIKGVIRIIDEIYSLFGFKYHVELSTMPEDHMGDEADWVTATEGLRKALEELNMDYVVNEGDGAFYGPKIDFHLEDSIGRTWQCGTIQLDFQMPMRFELEYVGSDGLKHRPIMVHRAAFGSIERFIGILIEHFAGKFPTWLSPVQVRLLPITDRNNEYTDKVEKALKAAGVRCESDRRQEKTGFKVRESQMARIPYMLVLGDKEQAEGTVSVRRRDSGEMTSVKPEDFIDIITKEIKSRKSN